MPRTIELDRFTVKADEQDAFLAERDAMTKAAQDSFEGFIDELLVKLDDGSYVSIWTWEAREYCDRAMARVDQVAPVTSWLAHVEVEISMEFGVVVDAGVGRT